MRSAFGENLQNPPDTANRKNITVEIQEAFEELTWAFHFYLCGRKEEMLNHLDFTINNVKALKKKMENAKVDPDMVWSGIPK